MNWDLGFGYEDSQSEGDFHSVKSDQRTKSKGIKKQNVRRGSNSGRRIKPELAAAVKLSARGKIGSRII